MSNSIGPNKPDAAAAIDEVLIAETAARQAMEACRTEAEEILEAAREDARRINRLATGRATRLHSRCNELVHSRITEIRAAAREDAVRTELNDADREMLARAIERLAARMTRPGNG
jgi:cell division septum initiation protein DivIVA